MKEPRYGWVMVALGAFMTCIAVGAMFSLAVFLRPITAATGWSTTAVSAAMTLNFLAMGAAGFGWGALSDRKGPRWAVLPGAVLLGLGLFLASRAQSPLQFQLAFGLLVGISVGSFFAPMITAVMGWITGHRGLAVSLVSVGVGVAPLTMSPFVAWLSTRMDWREALVILAVLVWATLIPAALFVRRPPAADHTAEAAGVPQKKDEQSLGQALRSPPFIILAATFFACCAAHAGPIFHTVSYAMVCGLAPMTAVTIYSVEGLAGLGGRLAFGVAADKLGVKRVLITGLLVQAIGAGSFALASRLGEFYFIAAIFGFAYGGVMPLYAVLAREYFGQRHLGAVFGAAAMVSSLGMALGPALGGWIFDTFGQYTWMYIGSAAVGLGAVAIALMFPPVRTTQRAIAAA
ncbi:MFS transporter [Usitatibacter palustris]|uniref:L-lactate transporter n=1 Tax=Usitatibacter palustris TaxID=2732487 RepID=A0A6M4H9H4_9PROT|nr:MFS transporter [Usitatibacter palustris]QJR15912.1 L-lactate transporter [Usitatibacter palustris]